MNFVFKDYNPSVHGAIVAMRLYNNGKFGITPYAELAFAFGGSIKVRWDDIRVRECFAPGITAYTLIYDERIKYPFEAMIKPRTIY